ncbi:tRNA-uridine aminocarboxypropyltransferase 2-like isoform X2 [Dreissena polymorpha]|uniref:tRNA-uridine aminocarboxypropyltransferase 2-like isoform X2 n=1 Tax=Dreissena polymorpha TaxID=45954 RepID=UPI002264D7CD|nr:tRNA-uridine aminocarboxypropyltransferase 2-like isoform X2 [Dreissena polymorpha]
MMENTTAFSAQNKYNTDDRPATVCWCPFLPEEKISTLTTVYILQHPQEELRKLKTAPMLKQSLVEGKCHIIRGKKFGPKRRYEECLNLAEVLRSPNTLLLFPGDDAVDVQVLPSNQSYNLVVIDGTWSQARGMYANNELLKLPKKVQIASDRKSLYVIRTQPTDTSLSTLESVAIALATLERRPELVQVLTAPLEALCEFQLSHGAVPHQSKEYRIAHGQWTKMLPKSLQRRLERERRLEIEKQTPTLKSVFSGDSNDSVRESVHCVGKGLPVDSNDSVRESVHSVGKGLLVDNEESDVDKPLAGCFNTDCDIDVDNSLVICQLDISEHDDVKHVLSEKELDSVVRKCEQTCALPCS